MAGCLHNFPKADELIFGNLSVVIKVYLIEELLGGELSVVGLPVLDGFLLVDVLAAVDVEDFEGFYDLSVDCLAQFLHNIR